MYTDIVLCKWPWQKIRMDENEAENLYNAYSTTPSSKVIEICKNVWYWIMVKIKPI